MLIRKPMPIMRPYILIGIGPRTQLPKSILGISNKMGCMASFRKKS